MQESFTKPLNTKLIFSVYFLFVVFIVLILFMTATGNEKNLSSNDIDRLLSQKWSEKNLSPSQQSTDEEFLRRVTLDLTGRIPTAVEVKSFLDDNSSTKRQKKIDELLASEEFGNYMADVWLSILFPSEQKTKGLPKTYALIKYTFADHFNQNKPFNKFVYNLVSADGFVSTNPYALYVSRFETPEDAAGNVMKVFAGKQIQCAQCHKHPYENITQEDFYGVAAFFSRKKILPLLQKDQAQKLTKPITRMEKVIDKARDMEMEMSEEMVNMQEHEKVKKNNDKSKNKNKNKKKYGGIPPQWAIDSLKQKMNNPTFTPDLLVWDAVNGQMEYEIKGVTKVQSPKYLNGASVSSNAGIERRKLFAEHLTTKETNQLAKEFVNRFWKHFFGYGFVNPIDDFTGTDEGTNPELLNMLTEEFAKSNFDVKNLFKLITNTETYQLSSTPNSSNKSDHEYFSRAVLRPMSPVQLCNSILTASGYFSLKNIKDKDGDEIQKIKYRILKLFTYTFNDDEMNETEDFSGTITQALLLMNSDLAEKVTERKPGNSIAQMFNTIKELSDRIDFLYLNTLSRLPSKEEKKNLLSKANNDEAFYENVQWALLNSSEFIFNH